MSGNGVYQALDGVKNIGDDALANLSTHKRS